MPVPFDTAGTDARMPAPLLSPHGPADESTVSNIAVGAAYGKHGTIVLIGEEDAVQKRTGEL